MDAAALSLNIDSSKVVTAANDLDRFSASSDRAAASAGKLNFGSQAGSIAKMVALVQSIDSKMSSLINTLAKAQQAEKALASANDNSSRSMDKADAHVTAYTQHLAAMVAAANAASSAQSSAASQAQAMGRATASADSHVTAYRQHLQGLVTQLNAAKAASSALGGAGAGPSLGGVTASAAELQRYIAAVKGAGAANDNATTKTLAHSAAQEKLGQNAWATTANIRAQIEALRELGATGGGGEGANAGGAIGSLRGSFGILEAAALAAAAALRDINAGGGAGGGPSGGAGGAGGNPRSSSSPYYGAAGFEQTGQAAKLAAHEAQNLFYQLNDVFVSLISGQKPITVFMQQGSQIGQIYATSGLSIKNFMLALASMLGILTTTTAATEAAALAQARQSAASIAAANAQAASNVRAAETNIAIARTQIAMATTATEAAAAEARLAIAVSALAPAQAEAAITARALAKAQEEVAAAAAASQAATVTSVTALGVALGVLTGLLVIGVAAIATLNAEANKDAGLKKYTTAMGYTKEEVKKLNAVTVTWGDTFKAVFQVGFERAASALGISAANMGKAWKSALSFMMTATREVVAGIYASFTGLGYAVKRTIDNIRGGKVENPLSTLVEGYKTARGDAMKFMDDVVKQSQKTARARQDAMAKAMYDKPSTPKGGKSDAEKLADIVRSAEAEIKAEQARGAAVGLSARAAAELEQRTKLLNQIEKAKIPITAAVTKEVDRLAKAYADAKIAADVATAIQGVTDSIDKQRTSINDQTNLIGLYGDELTRARIQMEALTAAQNALPRGVTLSGEDANRVSKAASGQADDQILQDRNRRMETVRKDAEDAMYSLDLERKGLGLTGASAEAYAYVVERLNAEKRAGVELSPDEIRAIEAAGKAYGQARYSIDQQAQAIADAREVTKGFFSDWINGVREGGNLFRTFADSVINSLNRIIDKLLDKTLNGFLDSMFAGGGSSGGGLFASIFGGGSAGSKGFVSTGATVKIPDFTKGWDYNPTMNALGGVYGAAQRFAKGGAFTNTVVNTPTLFRFANGAQIGEMGEAGAEAIMPLKRGPNGSLGVEMHGGGKPSMRLGDNYFTIRVEGGFMPDAVIAVARQAGQEAVDTAKRSFQDWAAEWDQGGAVVS